MISEGLWRFYVDLGKVINTIPEGRIGDRVAEALLQCGTSQMMHFDHSGDKEFSGCREQCCQDLREAMGWLKYAEQTEVLPTDSTSRLLEEAKNLLEQLQETSSIPGYRGLDHLAIAVASTEEALQLWRDRMGFPVVCSEVVNEGSVRLTHLDLGNTHLQLVEPLLEGHPLYAWLADNGGAGLHHLCFRVEDIDTVMTASPLPTAAKSHQGTGGKRAVFLEKKHTGNVLMEYTGA
ncbi:VOC family protein [Luteolibacter algae]|uniref:VOC family protein n=2 Tax=Luteolibacter algae TaxID=454151 RepID=A0ABW5DAY6_9BACT